MSRSNAEYLQHALNKAAEEISKYCNYYKEILAEIDLQPHDNSNNERYNNSSSTSNNPTKEEDIYIVNSKNRDDHMKFHTEDKAFIEEFYYFNTIFYLTKEFLIEIKNKNIEHDKVRKKFLEDIIDKLEVKGDKSHPEKLKFKNIPLKSTILDVIEYIASAMAKIPTLWFGLANKKGPIVDTFRDLIYHPGLFNNPGKIVSEQRLKIPSRAKLNILFLSAVEMKDTIIKLNKINEETEIKLKELVHDNLALTNELHAQFRKH